MKTEQLKVLIVDDEDIILQESIQKISNYVFKENIYSANNAVETMRILKTINIDIAFLDVEMPETSGFSIAEFIQSCELKTKIVFLTGHVELGAKSFDYEPLDFLTKPLDVLRLKKTFDRYFSLITPINNIVQIAIETSDGFALIKPTDIEYIARENRKTVVYCTNDTYILRYSLDEVEEIFCEFDLYRCHQSFIIPLSKTKKVIQTGFGKTYYVVLTSGKQIPVSYTKYINLKKIMLNRGIHFI